MRYDTAVDKFMVTRSTSGYAPNTLRNNSNHLRLLGSHLPGDIQVQAITPDRFEQAWREMCVGRSPNNMINALATCNTFFKWCQGRSIVPGRWVNPTTDVRAPKPQKRERFRVPVSEFRTMLDTAEDPRDRALIAAACTLLLRKGELQTLTIGDVNLADGEVSVTIWKTKDADMMPIARELDTELRRWLTAYAEAAGPLQDDWLLFPARQQVKYSHDDGGRFSAHHHTNFIYLPHKQIGKMEDIVTRVLVEMGYTLEDREGMHTMRRSAARWLFDRLVTEGYDGAIRLVQAMLHHSQIVTTERYIGLTLDKKKRDDILRGEIMYPIASDNVIELRNHG